MVKKPVAKKEKKKSARQLQVELDKKKLQACLLYTSPSPRDG